MNIQELVKLNKLNGGHFFDKETMWMFGDTLSNFKLEDLDKFSVRLTRIKETSARRVGNAGSSWIFSKETGRVVL